MQPKPTIKNPYTIQKQIIPIAETHAYEVHTKQVGCTVITKHYDSEAAQRERILQLRNGYSAEVVEASK